MPNSEAETFFFYLLAVVSILSALVVVLEKRLLRSAVALMLLLICGAGLSIILDYELIAGIQVMVFVGGIVVLMIFAIMMTSDGQTFERKPTLGRKLTAAGTALLFFTVTVWALTNTEFKIAEASVHEKASTGKEQIKQIGMTLLSNEEGGYVLTFEVISLLLLAALIGGIVVARRKDPDIPPPPGSKNPGSHAGPGHTRIGIK